MRAICTVVALAAAVLADLRWLRVAQREHYLAGAVSRFAWRWWSFGANRILVVAPVVGLVLTRTAPLAGAIGVLGVAAGPYGLSVRGRTSKLAWTRRLRTLAAVTAGVQVLIVLVGFALGDVALGAVIAAVAAPSFVDAALLITKPIEERLAQPFVHTASIRLRQVAPTIVGITGSYGKTSTKNHLAHLVAGTKQVVPTPRSFNNRAGLATAVNEHLALGTEVFIAEMGTYGLGEIAEMVEWCPPAIGIITAIGPVHLERMRTEETIARAKEEILGRASTAIVNVDSPLLRPVADRAAAAGKKVVRVSAMDPTADVVVVDRVVTVGGREVARMPADLSAAPSNIACAVAAAIELGVAPEDVASRLATIPPVEFRQTVSRSADRGYSIIDDTYNANPTGARTALELLAKTVGPTGRQVLVTPGMVELGVRQKDENRAFAALAGAQCSDVVVVGHTNRTALVAGARSAANAVVHVVETRQEALDWVRSQLGDGDAVLFECDLPDHHP